MKERLLAAIDANKFKKFLKDHGTNMTRLEKELEKPIRKYVRYGEMPWSVITSIIWHLGEDNGNIEVFIDHKEEILRDATARIKDLERMIYLLRNEVKILTRDNERLSAIMHSYEKISESEKENENGTFEP